MCSLDNDTSDDIVDLRHIMGPVRNAMVYSTFRELDPGASVILVSDQDPSALCRELEQEYLKEFSWSYVERGPVIWQVAISRCSRPM